MQLFGVFVRQPGRDHARDEADQPVEDELHRPAFGAVRGVGQRRAEERHETDDQHPHRRRDPPHMHQDVVDRAEHQRRHDAEQIIVLQRLHEHDEQLRHFAAIGLGPVAGLIGGHQQQQEAADERPDGCEDQIAFHGVPLPDVGQV
ncbi:hypothetical protein chiPu_0028842 [Chiloscyllium punctatum]|uniref:Uncharacterized protein n=1 Tax=Chiloscyllium punctatum TaxID=137246 RepID=A0A401TQJ5_CHIPU|nr:hypothetical protein [Chiloscyllium punctatum]